MTIGQRIAIKATSGRFIIIIMVVLTLCIITIMHPDSLALRMFDFGSGLAVGYFGQSRDKPPPGSGTT